MWHTNLLLIVSYISHRDILYKKSALCNTAVAKGLVNGQNKLRDCPLRRTDARLRGHGNCGTGPDIAEIVVRKAAAHPDLAAVGVETHARNNAIAIPRTRTESDGIGIQVFTLLVPILQSVKHPLNDPLCCDVIIPKVASRKILVLFVGFHSIPRQNGVGAILGMAIVYGNCHIQVVGVAPALEFFAAHIVDPVLGLDPWLLIAQLPWLNKLPGNDDETVKALLVVGNLDA